MLDLLLSGIMVFWIANGVILSDLHSTNDLAHILNLCHKLKTKQWEK